MASARPGLIRNAVGSMAVLAIVAFVAFGLPLIDRSLPANRPVAAGAPFTVGAGVTVRPPQGASLDLTRTRPDDDRGTAVFVVGGVRFQVVAAPFPGGIDDAARRLRGKITNISGYQVTGAERRMRTTAGVEGIRGGYSSPGRLGQYAVFVHDGVSVEITANGPQDRMRSMAPALLDSVHSLSFEGRRP